MTEKGNHKGSLWAVLSYLPFSSQSECLVLKEPLRRGPGRRWPPSL